MLSGSMNREGEGWQEDHGADAYSQAVPCSPKAVQELYLLARIFLRLLC